MAELRSVDINEDGTFVHFKVTKKEYDIIRQNKSDFAILPLDPSSFQELLTSGKLGMGNRIMIPNRLLSRYETSLKKKLPAGVYDVEDSKLLLILLEGSKLYPEFGEDKENQVVNDDKSKHRNKKA